MLYNDKNISYFSLSIYFLFPSLFIFTQSIIIYLVIYYNIK